MFKSKNLKEKSVRSNSKKGSLTYNDDTSSSTSSVNVIIDENQSTLLTQWLDQLNREKLITVTDQNDIVVMAGGQNDPAQQIFINCNDIDQYMETKRVNHKTIEKRPIIAMSDIARILLQFGYVHETSGQLSYGPHAVALGNNELKWLTSIVRDARPDPKSSETEVSLFDGENTQLLCIPYEYMTPTNDTQIVANYLFRNGHVRYDVKSRSYAYRYIEPDILLDEKIQSPSRINQHQFLSFHIKTINVDQLNKRIRLQFRYEPNQNLILPDRWYRQVSNHHFDRDYIIDILLANGGRINRNTFFFLGRTYSLESPTISRANSAFLSSNQLETLNLPSNEKNDLIRHYIDLIIKNDGAKQDETNQMFVLENSTDGRRLYFTPEHSQFIRQNQFRRQDVIQILIKYAQIKQNQSGYWLLYYNNQYIQLPSSLIPSSIVSLQSLNNLIRPKDKRSSLDIERRSSSSRRTTSNTVVQESLERYHQIIDYMCRHGLVTWDKSSKLIRIHFSDQTLLLPIDHIRSIINPRILSSSSTISGVLPFTSRQLSQWLINNSYMTRKNL